MKGRYDDFIEDMLKDNKKPAPNNNLNDIGKQMEEQVKKAFEKASKEEPVKVPKKDISPEQEEEPEDIDTNDTDEDDNKEDL